MAIQRAYLKAAMDFYACHDLTQVTKDILVRWEDVLDKLERDPRSLVRELDWVAKRHMIESYMERKGCGWDDPRVRLMDLQYHDVRPDKGLYYTLERSHLIERIVQDRRDRASGIYPAARDARLFPRTMCQQVSEVDLWGELDVGLVRCRQYDDQENSSDGPSPRHRIADGRALGSGSRPADALLAKLKA